MVDRPRSQNRLRLSSWCACPDAGKPINPERRAGLAGFCLQYLRDLVVNCSGGHFLRLRATALALRGPRQFLIVTSRAVIEAGKKLAMGNLSNVECLLWDV